MRYTQVLVSCILLSVMGCSIPLRKQFLNDDLFSSPKVLESRLEPIKAAWASHQTNIDREFVFRRLANTEDTWNDVLARCNELLPEEIFVILYPRAQVLGTVDELNKHSAEMCHFTGCSLAVRHLETSSIIGFPHYTIFNTGHDQRLILIFEVRDGSCSDEQVLTVEKPSKTVRVFMAGRAKVDEHEVVYYWDVLLEMLQGAIIEGGKNAGRAATF